MSNRKWDDISWMDHGCRKIKDVQNALMQFIFENGAVEKEVLVREIKKFK